VTGPTIERFTRFPRSLARRARTERLGPGVPTLLAHPDWERPAPVMFWMHGRTATKELDPGRYLRWIRAGVAACAIDLPGHGQRLDPAFHRVSSTRDLLERVLPEIDAVLGSLSDPRFGGVFDLDRVGIGGMSAGGMATLRRLCEPNSFRCAAVESTTGDLGSLFSHGDRAGGGVDAGRLARLDPMANLDGLAPIPLLVLHSEADAMIPWPIQSRFLEALAARYARAGADPALIRVMTWAQTGAPGEHAGFGRYSNEAKNAQTAFLVEHLLGPNPGAGNGHGR